MNKFWQLIIAVRNLSYHWTVKQHNEKWAATEYKQKVYGFISGYLSMIILIVFQVMSYFFGLESKDLPVGREDPWWMKLIAGGVMFGLPWFLVGRYLLRKLEHIPIPTEYDPRKFSKHRLLFWGGFIFGWFLTISIGMFLTVYLRGNEIHLFNLIINEGGYNHTFKEDFGL
jgi:hypothetical protein